MMYWPLPRLNRAARLLSDWERQLAETNAIIADIHDRQDTIRKTLDRCHAHADAIEATINEEIAA